MKKFATMNTDELQAEVIRYLYGDMAAAEMQALELAATESRQLRDLLDDEQQFHKFIPRGSQPSVSEQRVQANRYQLQKRLQQINSKSENALAAWLRDFVRQPLRGGFQVTAMAATFVFGVYIANEPATTQQVDNSLAVKLPAQVDSSSRNAQFIAASFGGIDSRDNQSQGSAQISPLQLVGNDDYEIFEFDIERYDAATGEIQLSFSLAAETRVSGNVSDADISNLMAVALQDDIDSSARLDTVDVLQSVMSGPEVFQAMTQVLRNDPNPGVRYEAAQALVSLTEDPEVRDALRYALREDTNPGVRLAAFDALAAEPELDSETLDLFRERMDADGNEYIRNQSRALVQANDPTLNSLDI